MALTAGIPVPDPLPLRSIPVPAGVTRIAGCDCGSGCEWHQEKCSIWSVPRDVATAAISESRERQREWGERLNARLRESLAALAGRPAQPG